MSENFLKYKKVAPIYTISIHDAKTYEIIEQDQTVDTLEGKIKASKGEVICLGICNDLWPQSEERVKSKYKFDKEVRIDGVKWKKWQPEDGQFVEALQKDEDFKVDDMNGKKGDYLIRSLEDNSDKWIVDQNVFEKTYEEVKE